MTDEFVEVMKNLCEMYGIPTNDSFAFEQAGKALEKRIRNAVKLAINKRVVQINNEIFAGVKEQRRKILIYKKQEADKLIKILEEASLV